MKPLRLIAPILLLALLAGCVPTPPPPGASIPLAIYLTDPPLSGAETRATILKDLRLQPTPIIAPADILGYNLDTHTLTLTPAAIQRVMDLKIPVSGTGFVLTANDERIYAGAFWTLISSLSSEGPIILQPFDKNTRQLTIDTGYPSGLTTSSAGSYDPRADPRILDAVK